MSSEPEKTSDKCEREEKCIPEEVRIKYFPHGTAPFSYDVLPLFEVDDYKRRIMCETSFLRNPNFAAKWEAFKEGLPQTARDLVPVSMDSNKIAVFANYRRQKVPPDFYAAFVGPSSPHAIFRRMK